MQYFTKSTYSNYNNKWELAMWQIAKSWEWQQKVEEYTKIWLTISELEIFTVKFSVFYFTFFVFLYFRSSPDYVYTAMR